MKIIYDSLTPIVETWDDPGDYPNNVAASPLPSYQYMTGIDGSLVLELNQNEYLEYLETIKEESIDYWMSEVVDYRRPFECDSIKWKLDKIEIERVVLITLSVTEISY